MPQNVDPNKSLKEPLVAYITETNLNLSTSKTIGDPTCNLTSGSGQQQRSLGIYLER